jgi:hypothetical protein
LEANFLSLFLTFISIGDADYSFDSRILELFLPGLLSGVFSVDDNYFEEI